MNYPAFTLCCLMAMLALAGCGETTRPSSPAPTAVIEVLSTATPSPEPSPTAAPTVTPAPLPSPTAAPALTTGWRGLTVADEERCSPYHTDNSATRRRFSSDLLNLTLAAPSVNRHQKVAKDAAEWLPDLNRCWFADRVVRVRQKYGLTIDRREAEALDSVLSGCTSVEMVVTDASIAVTTPTASSSGNALELWDDNGNGRITCAEARKHGIAPVRRGHPAYEYMHDGDGDGIVCE